MAALLLAIGVLLAPTTASAAVTGGGIGALVFVESDGASDTLTVECAAGEAPAGFSPKIPCGAVQTIIVRGGGGDDTIELADVSRSVFPKLSVVEIEGGPGEDFVEGTQIGDTIEADSEDFVTAGPGNDLVTEGEEVFGGEGNDVLVETRDSANGGPGDDLFEQLASAGPFVGGPGADSVRFDLGEESNFDASFDVENSGLEVTVEAGTVVFFWNSIELADLLLSDGGTQIVDASDFSGVLKADGRGGPDTLVGGPGEDFLSGGAGGDDLTGGPNFDWVDGGPGGDLLQLRDGGFDRGLCGEDSDSAIADAADSLTGCEAIDVPLVVSTPPTPPPTPTPSDSPPDTRGLKGPRNVVKGKTAVFRFGSSEVGGSFKCWLDKGPLKPCASPFRLNSRTLKPGKHSLTVFAIDAAGNADSSPATLKFTVKPKPRKR